jgi:arylsulfatase A-like enzyme
MVGKKFLYLVLMLSSWGIARGDQRPNILLIYTDNLGWGDVSCYHGDFPTPNIDRLAREGMKFTSWYAPSSMCTPSRFGLMTGRLPIRSADQLLTAIDYLNTAHANLGIRPHETTIAQVLQAQKYRTALIGKWHLGHGCPEFLPTRHGFDSFYGHTGGCIDYFTMRYGIAPDWYRNETLIDETGYATDLLTEEAVRFLQGQAAEQPFFLYLAYNCPHAGKGYDPWKREPMYVLQAKPEDLGRVAGVKDPTRRVYAAMMLALDDGVGRVLASLDRLKLANDTMVIFTSDHGASPAFGGSNGPLRGTMNTLFEGGLRVPCVMRWPGKLQPGATSDAVKSTLDLFPTFCELAGASRSELLFDGVSLASGILGGGTSSPRELFWELPHSVSLREGKWKYLRTSDEEYLFDIDSDIAEQKNLAGQEPEILKRLKTRHMQLSGEYRAARP